MVFCYIRNVARPLSAFHIIVPTTVRPTLVNVEKASDMLLICKYVCGFVSVMVYRPILCL